MNTPSFLFIYGPLNGGGAERVLIDILRNFDYLRYQVDLCLMMPGGVLEPEVPKEVFKFYLWDNYSLSYKLAYRLSNILGCDTWLRYVLRKKITKKYDVVISFLEGMPLKLHAILAPQAINVTWVHCDLLNFPYEKNQFRKGEEIQAYNKMDRIICVSKDAKQAFHQRFPDVISSVDVIYNPIDRDKILKMSLEYEVHNEFLTIVTLGRLTPPKKIDRILRLAHRMKMEGYTDIRFQIIGDGELRDELLALRKKLEVEDIVEMIGFHKNPFPYVIAANMVLNCSGYEGFCLVICEAMVLGVPVISTTTCGPIEILKENNEYGLLIEHDDDSIYAAVKHMIDDDELRLYYHQKALERANRLGVEQTMESIYNLLSK